MTGLKNIFAHADTGCLSGNCGKCGEPIQVRKAEIRDKIIEWSSEWAGRVDAQRARVGAGLDKIQKDRRRLTNLRLEVAAIKELLQDADPYIELARVRKERDELRATLDAEAKYYFGLLEARKYINAAIDAIHKANLPPEGQPDTNADTHLDGPAQEPLEL